MKFFLNNQNKTSTFTSEANAFFAATGISDYGQKIAVNKLVLDLKGFAIWDKMLALYPMVGGTQATCTYNLANPNIYSLSWTGTWVFSNDGALPNGTNTEATPNFSVTTQGNNNTHLAYYSRTNDSTGTQVDIGEVSATNFISAGYGANMWGRLGGINRSNANADTRGFYLVSYSSVNNIFTQKNGVLVGTATGTSNLSGTNWLIARMSTGERSKRQCALASIGFALSQAEATNFYTTVQNFQTALGRQV